MKRIINVVIIIYLIIFIYNKYNYQKPLIFSLGNTINGNYVYKYNNTRITDIINDIKNNKKISNRNIQNILVKASTIYLDLNNLINCIDYDCTYTNCDDLEELLIIIRKYSKEKIIIRLLSQENEFANYINEKVMILAKKYDIITMR